MTLSEFRAATASLPGDIDLKILAPWGDIEDAVIIQAADLDAEDPVRECVEMSPMVLVSSKFPALT